MYCVFFCGGGVFNDVVFQFMIDVYNDGVDIVFMFFGLDNGFEDVDFFGQIVINVKKCGIVIVVVVGNVGFFGFVLIGFFVIVKDVIVVVFIDVVRFLMIYKMKGSIG